MAGARSLRAAPRILWDAAAYRVRKREGGNLVASTSLAVALALPPADVAHRFAFGLLLNLFVYLLNDCFDVRLDLGASGRDAERTRFLHDNLRTGWGVVAMLGAATAAVALAHGPGLLLAFALGAALVGGYSAALKRLPVADVAVIGAAGLTGAMVGFPLDSADGWRLAGLPAILCAATEAVQVIRDAPSDRASGLRTTAVVLGPAAAAWMARILIMGAAAYAALLLHGYLGLLLLAAVPAPLDERRATRTWDLFRVVFGLTWIAILVAYRLQGGLGGWISAG